jgi:hypothetical protein
MAQKGRSRTVIIRALLVLFVPFFTVAAANPKGFNQLINALINNLMVSFRELDPYAVVEIAAARDELPRAIRSMTKQIQPILAQEIVKMQENMNDHAAFNGYAEASAPIWPQTSVMVGHVSKASSMTLESSFTSYAEDGFKEYATIVADVTNELEQFIKDSNSGGDGGGDGGGQPPCVTCSSSGGGSGAGGAWPSPVPLQNAVNKIKAEINLLRSGASLFNGIEVKDSDTVPGLVANFKAAQQRLAAIQSNSLFVIGAKQARIDALSRCLEQAEKLGEKESYNFFGYRTELVHVANEMLDSAFLKDQLEVTADYLEALAGEAGIALESIVKKLGDEPGMLAFQIMQPEALKIAQKAASYRGIATGMLDQAVKADLDADAYWTKAYRFFCAHCFHETRIASTLAPIYGMADQITNLSSVDGLLTQLNSDLWGAMRDEVMIANGVIKANVEQRVRQIASTTAAEAGALFPDLGKDAIPGVPQMRFTDQCGVYREVPTTVGQLQISAAVSSVTRNLESTTAKLRRVFRETKRRSVQQRNFCLPTDPRCGGSSFPVIPSPAPKSPTPPKAGAPAAKRPLNKVQRRAQTVARKHVRRARRNIPALLNKAYFNLYKKYPQVPFR